MQVATWSDAHGLTLVQPKYVQLRSPASYDTNKTYLVTTIIQEPYLMQKKSTDTVRNGQQLDGFCKDLADLISKKMGIKCKSKIVRNIFAQQMGTICCIKISRNLYF